MMDTQQLLERFSQLRAASLAGTLSPDDFVKAIRELRIQDEQGIWWTVDVGGRGLLYYDEAKKAWCPAPETESSSHAGHPRNRFALPSAGRFSAPLLKPPLLGMLAGLAVFFASGGLSAMGWEFLGWVPQATSALAPQDACAGSDFAALGMFLCSALTAFLSLLGSSVTLLVLFLLRRPLVSLTRRLSQPLPALFRPPVLSILAALLFATVWAGAHYTTGDGVGILPQNQFPAVIGLFTYFTAIGHGRLQRWLDELFAWRDRRSRFYRHGAAIGIPMLLAVLMTEVFPLAVNEQMVVIAGLLLGYLAFTPRASSGSQESATRTL